MKKPIDIVIESLKAAYSAVQEMGDAGKDSVKTDIDLATKGDKIAGKAAIGCLRKNKSIGVAYTEEAGKIILNRAGEYSAVMDDIDGTKNFKEGLGMLPHGTLIGIFKGLNPRFCDCIASGFLDFPSGNLFIAEKGKGARLIKGYISGLTKEERLRTTGRKELFTEKYLTALIDIYSLGGMAQFFAKYSSRAWLGDFRSSAAHMMFVAAGSADLFVQADNAFNPFKYKTAEEIGPGFLILKEAGGAILTWSGRCIDEEFVGLNEKKAWHLVYAATNELAQEFIKDMKAIPEVREYIRKKRLDR